MVAGGNELDARLESVRVRQRVASHKMSGKIV